MNDFGRDVVGQAMVELVSGLVHLLAQEMEAGQDLGSGIIGIKLEVIPYGIGREKAINGSDGEQFLGNDFLQQLLGIFEKLARLRALENGGIASAQFPGMEKRRPINEGDEVGKCNKCCVFRVACSVFAHGPGSRGWR